MTTVNGDRDWSWRFRGTCYTAKNDDPAAYESFFADKPTQRKRALSMCQGCPVRKQCLLEALEEAQIWGVWGGTDESDIRRSLWVDSTSKIGRNVIPKCPWCKTKDESLEITDSETRTIQCSICSFTWKSETTYVALRFYEDHEETELGEVLGYAYSKDLLSRESLLSDEQFLTDKNTDSVDYVQVEAEESPVRIIRSANRRVPSSRTPGSLGTTKPQGTLLPEPPLGLAASGNPETT